MAKLKVQNRSIIFEICRSPYLLLVAIAAGICAGVFAPEFSRMIAPVGTIYLRLLQMTIAPILVAVIITAVSKIMRARASKNIIVCVIIYSLLFLFAVGIISVIFALLLRPGKILSTEALETLGKVLHAAEHDYGQNNLGLLPASVSQGFFDFLRRAMPQNILAIFSGKSLQILFFSVLLGIAIGFINKKQRNIILGGAELLLQIFLVVLDWIMCFLPLGLFSLLAAQLASTSLQTILAMGALVAVICAVAIFIFVCSAILLALSANVSILQAIASLKNSLLMAFGTQSTFVAIPETITGMSRKLGFERTTVNLLVPFGAVFNSFSVVIIYGVATVFTSQLYEVSLSPLELLLALSLLVLAAVASAGSPLLISVATIGIVMAPLGLPSSAIIVLLLAVMPIIAPVVTATNIFAIAALTAVIAKKRAAPKIPAIATENKEEIAILTGAPAAIDSLHQESCELIYDVLTGDNITVKILEWQKDGEVYFYNEPNSHEAAKTWKNLNECFLQYRPDIVFNNLHVEMENAGQLQGFFATLSLPFTGNNLTSSVVGTDKILSKNIFKSLKINTPKGLYLGYLDRINTADILPYILDKGFEFPFFVKGSHSGFKIVGVNDTDEFRNIIEEWQGKNLQSYPIFIEEFIAGKEYCLGIFGNASKDFGLKTLPIAEICHSGDFLNRENKKRPKYSVNYDIHLPPSVRAAINEAGQKIHQFLAFSGFSKIIFRLQDEQTPIVLKVEGNPQITPDGIIATMLKHSEQLSLQEAFYQMRKWAKEDN